MPENRLRMFNEYKCKTLMPLNNILHDYTAVCTVQRPSSTPLKDNVNKKRISKTKTLLLVKKNVIGAPILFLPYQMKY